LLSIKENPYIVGFDIYFEYFSKIEKPKFRGFYRVISYNEFIASGTLNAFFIVGRSIGFIGHVLDEKRLAMPMYRHPMDDVLYDVQVAEEI
jgi:citrate synthase